MASWTAASVASRSARMLQGTSALSNFVAEASAHPARSSAWLENGPSRRTRSSERSEHQVRLVPDRERGRIARLHLARPIQLFEGFLQPALLQQRDAEVVRREA